MNASVVQRRGWMVAITAMLVLLGSSGSGSVLARPAPQQVGPAVSITKECPSPDQLDGARVGATIVYPVTVENVGDVELTGLAVSDSRTGAFYSDAAASIPAAFPTSLAVGTTETRYFRSSITQGDANFGNVDNSATVSTNELPDVTDDADCAFTPSVAIQVSKQCPETTGLDVGASIYYPIVMTNSGDLLLQVEQPVDSRPDGRYFLDSNGQTQITFPLFLSGSLTIYYSSVITVDDAEAGNLDNSVTVTATGLGIGYSSPLQPVTDTVVCAFTSPTVSTTSTSTTSTSTTSTSTTSTSTTSTSTTSTSTTSTSTTSTSTVAPSASTSTSSSSTVVAPTTSDGAGGAGAASTTSAPSGTLPSTGAGSNNGMLVGAVLLLAAGAALLAGSRARSGTAT